MMSRQQDSRDTIRQQPKEMAGDVQPPRPLANQDRSPDLQTKSTPTTTIEPIVANGGQKISVNHYVDGCVHIGVLYEGRGSHDPDYSLGFVLSPDAIRQLQAALVQIAQIALDGRCEVSERDRKELERLLQRMIDGMTVWGEKRRGIRAIGSIRDQQTKDAAWIVRDAAQKIKKLFERVAKQEAQT